MNVLKTLSVIAVLGWIAGPLVLGADAKAERTDEYANTIVKSDRIASAFEVIASCSTSAWPKAPAGCLSNDGSAFNPATRTVTVERRDEANQTSVLMRVPVVQTASR